MDFTWNQPEAVRNVCCQPARYQGYNMQKANPFDDRLMPFQRNLWCSNELLLQDPALRCAAKIQPLDVGLKKGTQHSHEYNLKNKLWY